MSTKNQPKTIGDRITELTNGSTQNYIFDIVDEIPNDDSLLILQGKFMGKKTFLNILSILLDTCPERLIFICPDDMTILEARKEMLARIGESPLYVCSDGLIGAPFTMKGFTIALTLPIKNEGETIAEVIESFLPVVDEIVIRVDDATTDNSFKICQNYTDDVAHFKWNRSFAEARNTCLRSCKSDWIFMTEGHESLRESSYPIMESVGMLPREVAMVNVKRWVDGKHSCFPWLTKNLPEIHYINKSHNAVVSDHPDIRHQVNIPQISTFHDRSKEMYDSRRKQRKTMNRINFYEELIKNPKDSRTLFYLANEHFDFQEYEKAIESYHRYLTISKFTEERYQAKLHLAKCYISVKKPEEAIKIFLSCFEEPVARNDHMIYLSELYRNIDQTDKAIYYLKMAATVDEPCSAMMIDPVFYREAPLQALCILFSDIGRLDDALFCANLIKTRFPEITSVDSIINQIEQAKLAQDQSWDDFHDKGLEISELSESFSV